ncbi:MAG TPA: efflux RND transporter periplasmic adaptor subunit [Longimicrobiales bacterium]|nr:efflux RND transporter periplasmic adaptor subunit [Longimicrobiales bacterium]
MKKWMKPAIGLALVVVLIAVSAFMVRGREIAETDDTALEFAVAEQRSIEVTAEAAGLVEPIMLVEVKSKASGEITALHVETGDAVKRGDLLGEVDPRDVRNTFAQAEADLAVAEARMKTAQAQKQRSEELRKANVITEQEYEAATFEEASARSQLVKARVNLELARERLGDVTIRAPTNGVIISKTVEVGTIIQSASQNISGGSIIFTMADLSEMQVRTLVDETDLGKIQPGQQARVSVEAFPGRVFRGTVLKIEPQAIVEQNVTMFPVLVHLANGDGALRPGMNAEVVIEVARRQNVTTIPNAAVVSMRDAAAAATMLGLPEDAVRTAMRGNGAGAPREEGDSAGGAARTAAEGEGAERRPRQMPDGAGMAQAGEGARMGGGEGARMGGRRGGGGAGIGNGDTRAGVVFVRNGAMIEPRMAVLGLNDWDNTEVVRGVTAGEEVVLISVARLQQQQQDMLNRMRERAGGVFPGSGGGRR